MTNTKHLILALVLAAMSLGATAQYSQLGSKNEFMAKVEADFAPFMGNTGTPGDNGYAIGEYQSAARLNAMAGVNISQDWFVGGGVGANYFFNPFRPDATSMLGATVFVDMDFRPIWTSFMGVDYQPSSINWSPMIGTRLGGSLLLGGSGGFSALLEAYGGVNWYYGQQLARGMRNKTRIWHSLYATVGVAYMNQTIFMPIRVGWRW